jgi:hypothetical protein
MRKGTQETKAPPAPPESTPKAPMAQSSPGRAAFIALAALALLSLAMFADVLCGPPGRAFSSRSTDVISQFAHWRGFGFGELRRGNLALWNPHLFCGAPFFGGFQSALLYPPNVLFLVLPLDRAVNWSIALHVFLAGAFTYLWAARRGLHPLACFFAATMFMFGGPHFLHIYAGHLPNLCAMVWAPLLFLAIDGIFSKPSLGWCLLGVFAFSMQILAGHPQYVFYTGVGVALYAALLLWSSIRERQRISQSANSSTQQSTNPPIHFPARAAGCLAAIVVGAVAITAIQLFTGLAESGETLRSTGLSYQFASMFSFPPENFVTFLAPNFFGDMQSLPYWGRCYVWEVSIFVSVTGLVLAIIGVSRKSRRDFVMVALLLVLALGAHTPLFKLFYYCVPGFDKFRGSSKFVFLASLFLSLLAAYGLDQIIRGGRVARKAIMGIFIAAFVLFIGSFTVRQSAIGGPDAGWSRALNAIAQTAESYVRSTTFSDPAFGVETGKWAAHSLLLPAGIFCALGVILSLVPRLPKLTCLLVILGVAELFWFARKSRVTSDLSLAVPQQIHEHLVEHPGDYRILNLQSPNSAMSMGADDIWGYDPGILRRYAEFIAFTQGVNPDEVTQYVPFRRDHPLYGMLRCRFMFVPQPDGTTTIYDNTNVLPRLELIQNFRVIPQRNELFAALTNSTFNPRQELILQTPPSETTGWELAGGQWKTGVPASPGIAQVVEESTDALTIEAKLSSPAILLLNDSYSSGWRARPLAGASQQHYAILPANYCLRAVPLAAGIHRFRLEYLPHAFVIGKWVSLGSLFVYVCLVALWVVRSRRLPSPPAVRP